MTQAQTQATEERKPLQVVKLPSNFTQPKEWEKDNVSLFRKAQPIKETKQGRVLQVKLNYSLTYGLNSMLAEIKKMGVKIEELKQGNYVVFVNTKQNKARMVTIHPVLRGMAGEPWLISTQVNAPKSHFLDLRVIKYLPFAYNGQVIDLDKASEMALNACFGQVKRRNANVFTDNA